MADSILRYLIKSTVLNVVCQKSPVLKLRWVTVYYLYTVYILRIYAVHSSRFSKARLAFVEIRSNITFICLNSLPSLQVNRNIGFFSTFGKGMLNNKHIVFLILFFNLHTQAVSTNLPKVHSYSIFLRHFIPLFFYYHLLAAPPAMNFYYNVL